MAHVCNGGGLVSLSVCDWYSSRSFSPAIFLWMIMISLPGLFARQLSREESQNARWDQKPSLGGRLNFLKVKSLPLDPLLDRAQPMLSCSSLDCWWLTCNLKSSHVHRGNIISHTTHALKCFNCGSDFPLTVWFFFGVSSSSHCREGFYSILLLRSTERRSPFPTPKSGSGEEMSTSGGHLHLEVLLWHSSLWNPNQRSLAQMCFLNSVQREPGLAKGFG